MWPKEAPCAKIRGMVKFYSVKIDFAEVPRRKLKSLSRQVGKAVRESGAIPMLPESPENPWVYALFRTRKDASRFRKEFSKAFGLAKLECVKEPAMVPESEFTKEYLEELGRKA